MVTLTTEQNQAVSLISSAKLSLFTGPPGSGKTTTLTHWLKTLDPSTVFCYGPTGRSAQVMNNMLASAGVRIAARTIHSGLIPERVGYDGNGWQFYYNRYNRLPCKYVVCDETSMDDQQILLSLLEACEPGTQVILVGDPNQLAPVGAGTPFIDLIDSGVVPHAKLVTVHRFAGRLAHVCKAINSGERWLPSPKLDLDRNAGEFGPENVRIIERKNGFGMLEAMKEVVTRISDRGFDPIEDMQVICSRNTEGPVSRDKLNVILQQLLNPNGAGVDDCPYRIGDKVMCLKNDRRETFRFDGLYFEPDSQAYVANGEQGVILMAQPRAVYCSFSNNIVKFTRGTWSTQLTLSYAITAHKSQGGGWPVVVYLVDDNRLVDRSLNYTAFSRAKQMCIIIGSKALIDRQNQKISVNSRKTFLKEKLQRLISS